MEVAGATRCPFLVDPNTVDTHTHTHTLSLSHTHTHAHTHTNTQTHTHREEEREKVKGRGIWGWGGCPLLIDPNTVFSAPKLTHLYHAPSMSTYE